MGEQNIQKSYSQTHMGPYAKIYSMEHMEGKKWSYF